MLQQWSEMVGARQTSGQTVTAWCKENGICSKTYYYRLKQLRLAALQLTKETDLTLPGQVPPGPVFTEIDPSKILDGEEKMPDGNIYRPARITVHIGDVVIDISNGAAPETIVQTLRVMKEIC